MANHVRQQIREAVSALLLGNASTGSHVFQSRVRPLAESELPALIVLTNNETITAEGINTEPFLNRELTLTVLAKAKATINIDDVLDNIIKEVEIKLAGWVNNNTLHSLVSSIILQSISIEINAENETPVGEASMDFLINYYTQASAPDISI